MSLRSLYILFFLFITLYSCQKKSDFDNIIEEPFTEEPKKQEYDFILNDYLVHRDTFRRGDNFYKILKKNNLGKFQVQEVLNKVRDSFNYYKIRVGKPVLLLKEKQMPFRLKYLVYEHDRIHYSIIAIGDSIQVTNKQKPVSFRQRTVADVIDKSLSESFKSKEISPALLRRLAKIYEYSIDFFKIRKGNAYALTITERFINDTLYDGVESIDGCFFEYKDKYHYAFPFKKDSLSTKVDYYDEEGKGLKNMFLKAPLDYFRISSKFSPKRFHPVQLTWKPHNGTDYAAPHGTPIKATASGIVEKAGYTTGNGNFVKIKHDKTFATQYLHMSQILVRNGQSVQQGQVIGKVGSTGLATGPHVCYRFWKNGKEVDPFKEKLPNTQPLDEPTKRIYLQQIQPLKRTLDSIAAIKIPKKPTDNTKKK